MGLTARFIVLAAMLASLPALAASAGFSGTWKTDLASLKEPKPYLLELNKGVYSCKVCEPPFSVKADGQPHKVAANPYADTVAIKVVDGLTVEETDVKDGKTFFSSRFKVDGGGNTASYAFVQQVQGGKPVTGKTLLKRLAAGPKGSHALTGTWQVAAYAQMSANSLVETLKLEADTLGMARSDGPVFTAKLDGSDAPYRRYPGTQFISVTRTAANTLRLQGKRDGKVVWVGTLTLAADGKTLRKVFKDAANGMTVSSTAVRQ